MTEGPVPDGTGDRPSCLQPLSPGRTADAPSWWCAGCSRPAALRADADGAALMDAWLSPTSAVTSLASSCADEERSTIERADRSPSAGTDHFEVLAGKIFVHPDESGGVRQVLSSRLISAGYCGRKRLHIGEYAWRECQHSADLLVECADQLNHIPAALGVKTELHRIGYCVRGGRTLTMSLLELPLVHRGADTRALKLMDRRQISGRPITESLLDVYRKALRPKSTASGPDRFQVSRRDTETNRIAQRFG